LTDLSTRAVPFHPGKPDDCSLPLLHRRLQASISLADWPLPLCVTRPKQVRLRYGSRVRFPGLRRADRSTTTPRSLSAERVIRRLNSFQFTRSARLGLAHQRSQRRRKDVEEIPEMSVSRSYAAFGRHAGFALRRLLSVKSHRSRQAAFRHRNDDPSSVIARTECRHPAREHDRSSCA